MIEFLISIDVNLFYFINQTLSNPLTDAVMPFITEIRNWYIVYIILFAWLFWKGGKHGRYAAVALILAIVITDQFNNAVLKDFFDRIRPCHVLPNVHLLVTCGIGNSFPSSHAANNFAAATILSFYYRQYRYVYFTIAALIALSRVFTGVHYPADVTVGATVGIIISMFLIYLSKKISKRRLAF